MRWSSENITHHWTYPNYGISQKFDEFPDQVNKIWVIRLHKPHHVVFSFGWKTPSPFTVIPAWLFATWGRHCSFFRQCQWLLICIPSYPQLMENTWKNPWTLPVQWEKIHVFHNMFHRFHLVVGKNNSDDHVSCGRGWRLPGWKSQFDNS